MRSTSAADSDGATGAPASGAKSTGSDPVSVDRLRRLRGGIFPVGAVSEEPPDTGHCRHQEEDGRHREHRATPAARPLRGTDLSCITEVEALEDGFGIDVADPLAQVGGRFATHGVESIGHRSSSGSIESRDANAARALWRWALTVPSAMSVTERSSR